MNYYKKYTKILSDVVKMAKFKYYNQLLQNSNNKSKIAWNIINSVTNKKIVNHDISSIEIYGKICTGYQNLASVFNKYFTSLPDTTSVSNLVNTSSSQANVSPLDYLKLSFTKPFSKIQLPPITRNEIIAIVKSLNLYATGFKLATVNLRVRHYFRLAFKFLYMVCKKLYYFRNQKRFNNGLNGIFWEIRQSHICVFSRNQ